MIKILRLVMVTFYMNVYYVFVVFLFSAFVFFCHFIFISTKRFLCTSMFEQIKKKVQSILVHLAIDDPHVPYIHSTLSVSFILLIYHSRFSFDDPFSSAFPALLFFSTFTVHLFTDIFVFIYLLDIIYSFGPDTRVCARPNKMYDGF